MAEPGDEAAFGPRPGHRRERERVPARVAGGQRRPRYGQGVGEEPAGVLGYAEEPRAAAEQPGGQRALHGIGCAQVGQPGGDGGWGEPVIGQRDQYRLEDPDLRPGRPALGHQPEGKLAESDLTHQVGRQVVAEQRDRRGVRGAERGGVPDGPVLFCGHRPGCASQARICSPCSSSLGGGSG
jgi:hypothetical protein